MNAARRREAALAALDNHARRYGVAIPDRLREFYRGDFDRYDQMYAKGEVEGWGGDTFQLALTPPTWLNKGDDAINGPRGEWEEAKTHVPLFVTDQSLYVVADVSQPSCPIGWYSEEGWSDGPAEGAESLDAFLASLTESPDTDDLDGVFRPADPDQEMDWEENFADDGPRVFDVDHGDND